jgi:hypothetical protein
MDTNDKQYMELVIKCKARPEPCRLMDRQNLDGRFGRVLHGAKLQAGAERLNNKWNGGAL